jgi:hypothetical protein
MDTILMSLTFQRWLVTSLKWFGRHRRASVWITHSIQMEQKCLLWPGTLSPEMLLVLLARTLANLRQQMMWVSWIHSLVSRISTTTTIHLVVTFLSNVTISRNFTSCLAQLGYISASCQKHVLNRGTPDVLLITKQRTLLCWACKTQLIPETILNHRQETRLRLQPLQ